MPRHSSAPKFFAIIPLAGVCGLAGACGDDAVSYSEPVGINLKAKSSDVVGATVTDSKGINTENGNPYGAFVANARQELAGADPGRIALTGASLLLGAGTTGVSRLGEVFAGETVVLFEMNDTNNTFPAANQMLVAADGAGPIAMDVAFESGQMGEADFSKLLAGSFKVVVRGPAATDFAAKGADADLQVTLTFTAYE